MRAVTRTCQARYDGNDCERQAVWIYRGIDGISVLCDECAERFCDTPDMPHVGEMIRARLTRLENVE